MADYTGLRVVHAANYQLDKDGDRFFNPDHKLHQGMVQNGCYVYPFSINDRARMASPLCSKTGGKKSANRALVQTCKNLEPDVLILGHGQYITRETLESVREAVPEIRIGFWYVDHLWSPKAIEHIHNRADLFDAIGCTSGGHLLGQFARPGCPAAFLPNPVEASIERDRAFENREPEYDLVFVGRADAGSERGEMLQFLIEQLSDLRLGFFGCLGRPAVFGRRKDQILASGRMAFNFNQRNDVELYSSDRIAQLTGNGLCTFIQNGNGFEQLYGDDEVVFFDDREHLVARILELAKDDAAVRRIAKNGWQKAHQVYSAQKCSEFLLNLTMRRSGWQTVPWAKHVYWHDSDAALNAKVA